MQKRSQKDTQFKPDGEQPLSRKVTGVKLTTEVERAIQQLPTPERGKWLRRVITEAAKAELMDADAIA